MTLPEVFTSDTSSPLYNANRNTRHYQPAILDYKYIYPCTAEFLKGDLLRAGQRRVIGSQLGALQWPPAFLHSRLSRAYSTMVPGPSTAAWDVLSGHFLYDGHSDLRVPWRPPDSSAASKITAAPVSSTVAPKSTTATHSGLSSSMVKPLTAAPGAQFRSRTSLPRLPCSLIQRRGRLRLDLL